MTPDRRFIPDPWSRTGRVSHTNSTPHEPASTGTGCPECSGRVARRGIETVCGGCGLIVAEDALDRGPTWRRTERPANSRRHVGAPLTATRHDRGLSTEIGFARSRSRGVSSRKRRRLSRMRTQHNRAQVRSKIERNRIYAFSEIRRLTAELDLPTSIREQACVLFKSAQREDLLRGRSLEGFAAAVVYANCRISGLSRTRTEILDAARATAGELTAAYRALNRELGLPVGPIDPEEYIPRFASKLDLPDVIVRDALSLCKTAHENGLVNGRNPCGVAGGCLYLAAKRHEYELTQKETAEVADVAPVTVRGTYHALR